MERGVSRVPIHVLARKIKLPNRFVSQRRRSPNLQQEIIRDQANITTGLTPGLINQFLDIVKEVGDVVLRLLIVDLFGAVTGTSEVSQILCFLLSKPDALGTPTSTDLDDPKKVVASYGIPTGLPNSAVGYHWRQPLKIKVPAVNDLYILMQNTTGQTVRCGFHVRLFWQST